MNIILSRQNDQHCRDFIEIELESLWESLMVELEQRFSVEFSFFVKNNESRKNITYLEKVILSY